MTPGSVGIGGSSDAAGGVARALADVNFGILVALFHFGALATLQFVLRRRRLVEIAMLPCLAVLSLMTLAMVRGMSPGLTLATLATIGVISWASLLRGGLLVHAVALGTLYLLSNPLTADPSSWLFPSSLLRSSVLFAIGLYGFRATQAGAPLIRDGL